MDNGLGLELLTELRIMNKNLEEQNNLKKLELYHKLGSGFGGTLKGRYELIQKMDMGYKIKLEDLYNDKILQRIKEE